MSGTKGGRMLSPAQVRELGFSLSIELLAAVRKTEFPKFRKVLKDSVDLRKKAQDASENLKQLLETDSEI